MKIEGIAADDPLNIIANESLRMESEAETKQGEFIKQGEQKKAADDLGKAREKAQNFIFGLSWATEKGLALAGSEIVMPDEIWLEGIEKFTPIFEKYDSDIKPEWFLKYIEPYKAEFKAGLWFGGTMFAVVQGVKAEKVEKDKAAAEAAEAEERKNNKGQEEK